MDSPGGVWPSGMQRRTAANRSHKGKSTSQAMQRLVVSQFREYDYYRRSAVDFDLLVRSVRLYVYKLISKNIIHLYL